MSSPDCATCDCPDKSKCGKKGNTLVIADKTEASFYDNVVDAPAMENGGTCKCGPSCACVDCTCDN